MLSFDKYLYKIVRVKTTYGRIHEGEVVSFEGSVSSKSRLPELSIQEDGCIQVVDESEIESIEIIEE